MRDDEGVWRGRGGTEQDLPVAIMGAGPVGLVAAAHLVRRGEPFVVLEAGAAVATNVREWGHVRLFTPWRYLLHPEAEALLAPAGWTSPSPDEHPTGAEYVERFLEPLSRVPGIADALRMRSRVVRVRPRERDVGSNAPSGTLSGGLSGSPSRTAFRLDLESGECLKARAVLDASGSWGTPNPLGGRGTPLEGEASDSRIVHGLPDVAGSARRLVEGQRVLVAGSGHSALHLLRELLGVQASAKGVRIHWIIRRPATRRLFGGGAADALPARGVLGEAVEAAVRAGRIELVDGFRAARVRSVDPGSLMVDDEGPEGRSLGPFDRILVATGFRPDLSLTGELDLALDERLEAPVALAPLVDPSLHACGSVRPHGWRELSHPEVGCFVAGVKSYGRAPTFLIRTGFEQVRSVVAHLAGDHAAAEAVEWNLPPTGVCVTDPDDLALTTRVTGPAGACCSGNGC